MTPELDHQPELALAQYRLDRTHDPFPLPDRDRVADGERLLHAQVACRDHETKRAALAGIESVRKHAAAAKLEDTTVK
jgi:hypothetical protein